ncbi:GNAT family N-acetyltransferase [Bacillus methanolicus]|uniref:GNAT family N-acetyltransferase n=1 Tax=Bacillus methanolicus TaxID=1471 RepID=UPI00200E7638|nr:GNAT family N-acetyltransferase [Bacillus methanolicus]UQD52237.1 GNAT family N-acetyltransferase [Bacillus methanolicus]
MIRLANVEDAHLIHQIMLSAFEEYRYFDVPSSALNESVNSIKETLKNGSEKALLCFKDGVPLGSVRFKTDKNSLYFFRLSVCPEARRRGIAKSMLSWLENYAKEHGKTEMWCKVRMSLPQNIQLYQSVGYFVCNEEVVTNPNGFPVKTVVMKKEL